VNHRVCAYQLGGQRFESQAGTISTSLVVLFNLLKFRLYCIAFNKMYLPLFAK
jgi:hypothetical protein